MAARRGIVGCCLAVALASLPAYAQPPVPQAAAGMTIETSIVLPHIADEFHGVVAEHTYIAGHFPTWHLEYSAHIAQNGREYDLIGMVKPDKTKVPVYFDITDWFGK
jgi:hypothetical protein